jgi:ABC-type phosphate transport system ATPase subunit
MEEQNVAIQVHGLQKSYQKLQVLKGVDFDVARGSIFALLGSNGAGNPLLDRGRPRTSSRHHASPTVPAAGDRPHGHRAGRSPT